jgi:RNA polymerase sigma factor (sigma-70 family)
MIGSHSSKLRPAKKDNQARQHELQPESTISLINRAQTGDETALEVLCTRYMPRLYRWATGRLPLRARGIIDTGDLVQETLIKVIHRLGGFHPDHAGAFPAYLRKAILNRIRDEIRQTASKPAITDLDGSERDPAPSPLEETIGRDLIDTYEQAFRRLKEDDRAVIFLKIELEMSNKEVADALNKTSADAARKAGNRALVRLAREMSAESRQ